MSATAPEDYLLGSRVAGALGPGPITLMEFEFVTLLQKKGILEDSNWRPNCLFFFQRLRIGAPRRHCGNMAAFDTFLQIGARRRGNTHRGGGSVMSAEDDRSVPSPARVCLISSSSLQRRALQLCVLHPAPCRGFTLPLHLATLQDCTVVGAAPAAGRARAPRDLAALRARRGEGPRGEF